MLTGSIIQVAFTTVAYWCIQNGGMPTVVTVLCAAVQVLQLAAANVPYNVLAARTGSKAITAAIDTLQVRRCSCTHLLRVSSPAASCDDAPAPDSAARDITQAAKGPASPAARGSAAWAG
jgi:hypothetical protein